MNFASGTPVLSMVVSVIVLLAGFEALKIDLHAVCCGRWQGSGGDGIEERESFLWCLNSD